jgi:hypothetical protein
MAMSRLIRWSVSTAIYPPNEVLQAVTSVVPAWPSTSR